ncbi:hypothetical protein EN851_22995 [Mesorhizobium sp. M8A.F.Ca.ET.208.01.1.1]|nr:MULTISPECIES: hypothetical protein [unclassified Mesorhizobium]TGU40138.1 hypothetical protein EN799_06810 [bacterium M00.F.Ca.ET.156.01.1.1]TGV15072.1 hypothetical protein EN816_06465 [Mesorhizobium sp. M8A.F.Ca.ET.173.01.1.1]TGQ77178.1 hypothetical protein EN850_29960 [Mesorhizobium sp. M8A.F.Ca.ET.207.01.1.1]TGQ89155.1 hypothetical protein EN851_22995 [Mesorhizobium sp. M8A.F.Ca.ET.208.01.1.1]TGR32259.1 hypothetical protein EN845_06810 [Mesorhizobium sp. M8A.F.Ca.ET.202.01.1.1]
MYLVQILLPRSDNQGEPFPRTDFDRVKEELAARFDGVTAYLQAPAEGLWKDGGETDRDDIVVFEVMTPKVDALEWQRRRSDLERRFRQDKIVVRYSKITVL